MVGGCWEKSQSLLSSGLCIETTGLAGKTRHVFAGVGWGEASEEESDETCLHKCAIRPGVELIVPLT